MEVKTEFIALNHSIRRKLINWALFLNKNKLMKSEGRRIYWIKSNENVAVKVIQKRNIFEEGTSFSENFIKT